MTGRKEYRRRWILDKAAVADELDDFAREWRKEQREHGHYVPARLLYNSTNALRELAERGLIDTDGMDGYAPN